MHIEKWLNIMLGFGEKTGLAARNMSTCSNSVTLRSGQSVSDLMDPYSFDDPTMDENICLNLLSQYPLKTFPTVAKWHWVSEQWITTRYSRLIRQTLDTSGLRSSISRGGPIVWSPLSPDLMPLGFFIWGDVKEELLHFFVCFVAFKQETDITHFQHYPEITPKCMENIHFHPNETPKQV